MTLKKKQSNRPGLPPTDIDALMKQELNNQDSESKTSMTVFPLEGSLEPNQSCDITFTFAPKPSNEGSGFKTKAIEPAIGSYRVPMQLRILKSEGFTSSSGDGEEPIDLLLMGKACPLQTNINIKEITFPSIQDSTEREESREVEVCLKNQSPLLGLSFAFAALAQFHAVPAKGKLQPGESKNIKIVFKPNQLGRFEKVMEILVSSLDKTPKQNPFIGIESRKPAVCFVRSLKGESESAVSHVQTIKLRLRGVLKPCKISPAAEVSQAQTDKVKLWRSNIQVGNSTVNEEWEDKIENRNKYLDYLKASRIQRLVDRRTMRIGNDGVKVPYSTLLSEDPKLDRENGLIPPEPDDYVGVARAQSATFALAEDSQRIKTLLNLLMEPRLYDLPNIDASIRNMDSYLTAEDLNNIFAARNCVDFGIVTVHSNNIQPINFLNLTPRRSSVHISIQTLSDGLVASPPNILLDPFTVSGFVASFKSDSVGSYNGKITYLVNGRYKYQIFTKAEVQPVRLELSTKSVNIEISAGLLNDQQSDLQLNVESPENGILHQAHEVIQVYNRGNFPTSFEWIVDSSQSYTSSGIAIEGGFEVEPLRGTIEANSFGEIKILYTAGIRNTCDKVLIMNVMDSETKLVCDTINVRCHGEIPAATCVLLTSTKQGPLDLGICPVGFSKMDSRYPLNVLASHLLIPSDTTVPQHQIARNFVKDSSWARGYRTIKVKNTSSKACFYSAQVVSNCMDVMLSAPSGIIQGNGGTAEVHIIATPTACGEFNDEVHICIIGGGRVLKVPFKYEGKQPKIAILPKNFGDLSLGTILGTSTKISFELVNDNDVGSRAVIDFRHLPEFKFQVVSNASLVKAPSSRAVTPGGKRPKSHNNAISGSSCPGVILRTYSVEDEIFKFDSVPGRRMSMVKKKKEVAQFLKRDAERGKLYVLDVHAFESLVCAVEFTPTSEKHFQLPLPISVIGSNLQCDTFVNAFGVKSPIVMSRSTINFKNKVVLKEGGIVGVSLLKSTLKETTVLSNNSAKTIQWSFDVEPLEDVDNVFKVEPFHGTLKPGATQTITVSFQPESVGVCNARIPLHIDFMGRQAPFCLDMRGTGVEPSIAFDPPEVFLPIVPLGQDSLVTFSVVNYGCERTEIKHVMFTEIINRHGRIEVEFPEGKLLKNDGEKLPVVLRFIGNPTTPENLTTLPLALSESKPKLYAGKKETNFKLSQNILVSKESVAARRNSKSNPNNDSMEEPRRKLGEKDTSIQQEPQVPPLPSLYGVPVSFTTKLEFSDSTRTFFIPIHGTLDASLLTIHSFVKLNTQNVLKIREGHIFFEPNVEHVKKVDHHKSRARMMMMHRPFRSPTGIVLEGANTQEITDGLNGKVLLEIVQSLSAKKKLSMLPTSAPAFGALTGVERVKASFRLFNEILSSLTTAGALLSSVKAEFLLTVEDFVMYMANQMESMQADNQGASVHDEFVEYQKKNEAYFQILSKEAWITVISQIIRIYALQIITPKHFRNLPGIFADESQLSWPVVSKGNIYSTSEVILLRWASYHMWKKNGVMKRLTNFGDDFKESVPYAYLLMSHIPELEGTFFNRFNFTCTTKEQLESNVKLINNALKEVYKTPAFCLPIQQVINAENPLENLLLLLFLYQTLPNFISKGKIDFHGALHESVTQSIELSNPSSRTLVYSASIVGENEFQLMDGNVFSLVSRGQSRVGIRFTSRFSRESKGQLRLTSKRMGLNNSSILIFDLVATVDAPVPKKIYTMDSQIYCTPPTQIGVDIINPFNCRAVFDISLIQSRSYAPLRVPHRGQPDIELPFIEALGGETVTPAAYRSTVTTLELGPFESATFPLTFQPFEPGHHKCVIHLIDKTVGEFQYQVEGHVKSPAAIEMLWSCKAHNTLEKSIRVTPLNAARDKALHNVLHDEATRLRIVSKSKAKDAPVFIDRDKYQLPKQTLRYKVDYLSPYFKGAPELLVKQSLYSQKEKKHSFNVEQNYTELHVAFCPKDPGKYSCKVILTCIDVPDVRVFKIHGVAISEGSKADLELQTPARQPLVQEIPIINKTDDDWTIKATIEGPYFTGAATIVAKSRATTLYNLSFCPPKSGETTGLLTLVNNHTSQKYIYGLRGIGQEPLPEENREIECVARETVSETFLVHNNSEEDVEYDVVTDLPNHVTKPSVIVPAKSCLAHNIQFRSIKVGTHLQLVTFVNRRDQSYVWFIIRLNVLPSPCVESLQLATTVRTAIAADILIVNPYDKRMIYTVNMLGNGLLGAKEIAIDANSEKAFVVTFAPLLSQKSIGSLIFNNDEVGEFWYELHLEALEAPPVLVPEMSAPLGKCGVQAVFVENPMNSEVTIQLSLSNTRDFQLFNQQGINIKTLHRQNKKPAGPISVTMKPLERIELQVVFWPSSLTEPSIGTINITSSQIGDFVYHLKGHGLMPEPMTDVTVRSALRKSTTSVISFFNPLVDPIPVTVRIIEEEKAHTGETLQKNTAGIDQEFALMLSRKPKYNVAGLDSLDIPFTYCPQKMIGRAATILVEMGQLRWIYPIMGLPDAPVPAIPKYYECRAREVLQTTHEIVLNEFNFDVEEIVSRSVDDWSKMLACDIEVVSVNNTTKDNIKTCISFNLIDVKDLQDEGLALKFAVRQFRLCLLLGY
ncbi:hypothetical protein BDR26DRAFT_203341 [Obelidium mucronatum]|nr:hypothetical protein BDR26DRAFT_203341 [Obelidium mucronatum]